MLVPSRTSLVQQPDRRVLILPLPEVGYVSDGALAPVLGPVTRRLARRINASTSWGAGAERRYTRRVQQGQPAGIEPFTAVVRNNG